MSVPEIVVGDVHGCLQSLSILFAKIIDRYPASTIIFTGDLVDRGPDSAGVIGFVSENARTGRVQAVLGNHDEMFLANLVLFQPERSLASGIPARYVENLLTNTDRYERSMISRNWLTQGGNETLESYGADPGDPRSWIRVPEKHIRFLGSLPLVWEGSGCIVSHAAADRPSLEAALTAASPWDIPEKIRTFLLWNRTIPLHRPHPTKVHISGHTPRLAPVAFERIDSIQIDTGCVYGNALTAYCPTDRQFISVPCNSPYSLDIQ